MEDWKAFYTRALNYLEALNIGTDEPDETKTGWKQFKMMFEGEDWQSLLDNETITPEHQKTLRHELDAIVTAIKSEDHFWHFEDKLLSDMCQRSDKGIHALNTCITTLVNQCKFPNKNTKNMLKIMAQQHTV